MSGAAFLCSNNEEIRKTMDATFIDCVFPAGVLEVRGKWIIGLKHRKEGAYQLFWMFENNQKINMARIYHTQILLPSNLPKIFNFNTVSSTSYVSLALTFRLLVLSSIL